MPPGIVGADILVCVNGLSVAPPGGCCWKQLNVVCSSMLGPWPIKLSASPSSANRSTYECTD